MVVGKDIGEGHLAHSRCIQVPLCLVGGLAGGRRLKGQAEACTNLYIVESGT